MTDCLTGPIAAAACTVGVVFGLVVAIGLLTLVTLVILVIVAIIAAIIEVVTT